MATKRLISSRRISETMAGRLIKILTVRDFTSQKILLVFRFYCEKQTEWKHLRCASPVWTFPGVLGAWPTGPGWRCSESLGLAQCELSRDLTGLDGTWNSGGCRAAAMGAWWALGKGSVSRLLNVN